MGTPFDASLRSPHERPKISEGGVRPGRKLGGEPRRHCLVDEIWFGSSDDEETP